MTSSIAKVVAVIRRHRRFLIASHVNPEADALGSALALEGLLRRLGKHAQVINDGGVPEALAWLPGADQVLARWSAKTPVEVAVTVDVPVFSRLGSVGPVLRRAARLISIDHHVSHENFGDLDWVDPQAAATGQMIYRLFQAVRVVPSKAEALCLYAALVTDTGSFRYRNTTPHVHRIAAELLNRAQVNPMFVSQQLYEAHRASDLRLLGEVLRGLQTSPDGRIAWVQVPRAIVRRAGQELIDELVNYPRAIKGVEVAFAMRQTSEAAEVRVSLRSKGEVDVDLIARAFGGGGHMAASGCTISGTLPQARAKLLAEIYKHIKA